MRPASLGRGLTFHWNILLLEKYLTKYCELHPTPFFPGGKNEMELRSQYPVDNFSFQ
jgi:hypothetical protein